MKLKKAVLGEGYFDENRALTKEEKRTFLEKVARYNTYGEAVHSKHNLVEVAKELAELAKCAEALTLSEAGEDFDALTVERNMKELKGLSQQFSKAATEAQALKNRVAALYEEMGQKLHRYYKIEDMQEQAESSLQNLVPKDVHRI